MRRLRARLEQAICRWALQKILALYAADASYGELARYGVDDVSCSLIEDGDGTIELTLIAVGVAIDD